MNSVALRLSTTVYAEAYAYIIDTTMVDNGDINAFKAKNCAYELHWLVNTV